MLYKTGIIRNQLLKLFEDNKDIILSKWLSLVTRDIKKQDNYELDCLVKIFKAIIENYINYYKDGNMKAYCISTMKIAEEIANNDIPYNNFIIALECFQESYTHLLIKKLDMELLDKCLTFSNKVYYRTTAVIQEVYFDIKDSTLTAIMKLSELRDDETGKHLERTKEYAIVLTQEMKLDFDFIKNMAKASLLHDIGKIAISDNILLKTRQA
jgi:response regulator RpfG family c-di-GMP phosphodiesterase